jgi:hypothetical protein
LELLVPYRKVFSAGILQPLLGLAPDARVSVPGGLSDTFDVRSQRIEIVEGNDVLSSSPSDNV